MLDILKFIFSSVWIFIGFSYLVSIFCACFAHAFHRDNITNNYYGENKNKESEDK